MLASSHSDASTNRPRAHWPPPPQNCWESVGNTRHPVVAVYRASSAGGGGPLGRGGSSSHIAEAHSSRASERASEPGARAHTRPVPPAIDTHGQDARYLRWTPTCSPYLRAPASLPGSLPSKAIKQPPPPLGSSTPSLEIGGLPGTDSPRAQRIPPTLRSRLSLGLSRQQDRQFWPQQRAPCSANHPLVRCHDGGLVQEVSAVRPLPPPPRSRPLTPISKGTPASLVDPES